MSEPRYDHHFPLAAIDAYETSTTLYTSQIDLVRFHYRSLDQRWFGLLRQSDGGEDGLVRYGEALMKSKISDDGTKYGTMD